MRARNHCCRAKRNVLNITGVYLHSCLVIRHSNRIFSIVMRGLAGSTIFSPHYFINVTILRKLLDIKGGPR